MSENEKNAMRREGFVAGADWARCQPLGAPTMYEAGNEAARRYPVVDVQQGPSGRWYRVVRRSRCEGGFIGCEVHSWADTAAALIGKDGYRIIEPQDIGAVAELLRRAAAERAQ